MWVREKEGHEPGHDEQIVEVSISTTAGFIPAEGFDRVPANQKIEVQLRKAQNQLNIKDTTGWIATATTADGKRTVDVNKSYRENHLSAMVEIVGSERRRRWLMHPAAVKALFEYEVANLSLALAQRRRWIFHSLEFPFIDCSYTASGRTTLRVRLQCDEWNDLPPSISLHTADGTFLATAPANPTGVFHAGPHPVNYRPFICTRGSREYHIHPNHVSDLWDNVKNSSSFTLGSILTQVWHAWQKGTG